jgi:hypothetical protein
MLRRSTISKHLNPIVSAAHVEKAIGTRAPRAKANNST